LKEKKREKRNIKEKENGMGAAALGLTPDARPN
jgi:hypothetical protein